MINRIENIFSEVTGITDLEFTEKTRFDKIKNVSSLTMIQLICAIEDEFDVDIPNSQLKKFKTVKDLVEFLEEEVED